MSDFHALKISDVQALTSNSVALTFEIPSNLQDTFSYIAGQYITLKHNHNGEELRRDGISPSKFLPIMVVF